MTFIRLVNTKSLPTRVTNSVRSPNTVDIQVIQEITRNIQGIEVKLLEQLALPAHVIFKSQFVQKLHKKTKRLEVAKGIL